MQVLYLTNRSSTSYPRFNQGKITLQNTMQVQIQDNYFLMNSTIVHQSFNDSSVVPWRGGSAANYAGWDFVQGPLPWADREMCLPSIFLRSLCHSSVRLFVFTYVATVEDISRHNGTNWSLVHEWKKTKTHIWGTCFAEVFLQYVLINSVLWSSPLYTRK